jgi:hypothetical protein
MLKVSKESKWYLFPPEFKNIRNSDRVIQISSFVKSQGKECYLMLGCLILTLIEDGGPLSGPNFGSLVWEGSGKTGGSPLWQFSSGLFIFQPPLSLKL